MTPLNLTLLVALAIITHEAVIKQGELPKPQRYVWAVIVFSILGIVAEAGAPQLAGIFGLGLVVAMVYTYTVNGTVTSLPEFVTGKIKAKNATSGSRTASGQPQPKAS